ncbi:MAG: T9SS type A sorting domain-containing protein [Candidatus Krumholzibacteriota bacterium]|nr:T9SS type A sorting domain-containing protein [Candidatus Krumholzibacteriota bacterium]
MIRSSIFLALLFLASIARSDTITQTVFFGQPRIVETGSGLLVTVDHCRTVGHCGEPMLPAYPARFLLPAGEKISSVSFNPLSNSIIQCRGRVMAMPQQYPLGSQASIVISRNEEIYRLPTLYPSESGLLVTEQEIAGSRIAFVNIFPCRVIPSTSEISFSSAIEVIIRTEPSDRSTVRPDRPLTNRTRRILEEIDKENAGPGRIPKLPEANTDMFECDNISYLIITSAELAPGFEPLAQMKLASGLKTEIITTEWISLNYQGSDLQEKIRNLIIDAWTGWQTEYVLLGGDDSVIPHRGMYVKVGTEVEPDIASDLYYACLDGDWNTDQDIYFGEPGEEDLIPEVSVGRIPAETLEEVSNFISKLESYAISPSPERCATSLMVGELLWSGETNTWGADCKDEILHGSDNYGFTTSGIPDHFDNNTLYDRDMGSWSQTHLLSYLNTGVNLVNHLGHASNLSVMRLAVWDLDLLDNTGPGKLPFICYSQACYPAAFDNRDDAGSILPDDAIGEQLINGEKGAVAFIGNTRLGWSSPGTTSGTSQYFDRQFFDAIFGEGISAIGEILDDSRIDNISYIPYAAVRYVMYGMCLLGDPAMTVWTGVPSFLTVTHDDVILTNNDELFTTRVFAGDTPVEGARVSLLIKDPDKFCATVTDASGTAFLAPSPDSAGTAILTVFAPDYYLYSDTVLVASSSDAHLEMTQFTIDDDSIGISCGDGNGIAESGEILDLSIIVSNAGASPAVGTRIAISCDSPFASLTVDTFLIGDLAEMSAYMIENELSLGLDQNIPNGYSFNLGITLLSGELRWKSVETITVNAPGVIFDSWALSDSLHGDSDGCLEAWEHLNLSARLTNSGINTIISPVLSLSCRNDGWLRITKKSEPLSDIPAGATIDSHGLLEVFVRELTPPFSEIELFLQLESENQPLQSCTLFTNICGSSISDEVAEEGFWRHSAIIGYDGWHISAEESYSSPSSWKCGSPTGLVYPNLMEAVLVTPTLCLYENSSLSFRHMMGAEAGTTYPYWAKDAGVVEISTDGGNRWTIINPTVAYPCRASSSNTIFLAPYQKCYSGSIGWKSETFDLSAWRGPVLLRFHFATDEQLAYTGWFIDDIEVSTDQLTDSDIPVPGGATALRSVYPNPFNPSTIIKYEVSGDSDVEITIYDVSGKRIRSLVNRHHVSGIYDIAWDGRNDRGKKVSSGVYLCRARIGVYSATRRLILLR